MVKPCVVMLQKCEKMGCNVPPISVITNSLLNKIVTINQNADKNMFLFVINALIHRVIINDFNARNQI